MFSKRSTISGAVVVGMVLAGGMLVAPGTAVPGTGSAAAWGYNAYGELGNSRTATSLVPVAVDTSGVLAGRTVTAISAGEVDTCVVADGRAYCWGRNGDGQLGNNSTAYSSVPAAVETSGALHNKTVTAIATGGYHSCAIADGRAYCWGRNYLGQLGNTSSTESKVPVPVDTSGALHNKTVTAISTGANHTCAVADARLYCWGENSQVPVAVGTSGVMAGQTVTAISAGSRHSCAVADGRAYCWGDNHDGQLGNTTTTQSKVPVPVDTSGALAGKTVTAISTGSLYTCALADGQAYCWGDNFGGRLGNNSTINSWLPVAVDTSGVLHNKAVTAISAGSFRSCAVADGRAYCWGKNYGGQLGNNTTTDSSVPVAVDTGGVLAGRTVTSISTGGDHTCAVADGRAYCWGGNHDGQLGNNATDSKVPVAVDAGGVLAGKVVIAISAGYRHTCAVADGRAYCWGNNYDGQLGNSTTTDSSSPVAVDTSGVLAGKSVSAIAAGGGHSCALADGRAYCWGDNYGGQLGNNSTADSSVPVAVNTSAVLAGRTLTAISAGTSHTCVVADGKAYCWGYGGDGRLGDNTTTKSSVPVAVNTSGALHNMTVTGVSAGGSHSCAVADSRAFCWGYNHYGELGNSRTARSKVPVAVDTGGVLHSKAVTGLSAGGYHTCAIADGRAFCWGKNYRGQLGNNSTAKSKVPVPVDTSGLLHNKTLTAISAGYRHTCALADGRAFCWGKNYRGQLGNNSTAKSKVPVPVDTSGVLHNKAVTAISAGECHTAVLFAAPTRPPATKHQTLAVKLPTRIKLSGLTVITPANARTNAGQRVRTLVRGGPTTPSVTGGVRYFTVVRGPAGRTSVRSYGYPNLRLKVVQKAPAVEGFTAFQRQATYLTGKRR